MPAEKKEAVSGEPGESSVFAKYVNGHTLDLSEMKEDIRGFDMPALLVFLAERPHIDSLNLRMMMGLSSEKFKSFFQMNKTITTLDVSCNIVIADEIVPSILNMTQLRSLDISFCSLTDKGVGLFLNNKALTSLKCEGGELLALRHSSFGNDSIREKVRLHILHNAKKAAAASAVHTVSMFPFVVRGAGTVSPGAAMEVKLP